MILDSDAPEYGGHGRLKKGQDHLTFYDKSGDINEICSAFTFPTRTALVLCPEDRDDFFPADIF